MEELLITEYLVKKYVWLVSLYKLDYVGDKINSEWTVDYGCHKKWNIQEKKHFSSKSDNFTFDQWGKKRL